MARKRSFERYRIARNPKSAIHIIVVLVWCAIGTVILPGGLAATGGGEQGSLEIRIKDHREAIGDFSRLTLKLDKIAISPKTGLKFWKSGWQDLSPSLESLDLTKYIGNQSVTVFKGEINAGSFDAIALKLKGVEGVLKKTQRSATIKNAVGPIKLSFSVQAQSATVIVLDLVILDVSDHPPLNYELGIKGWELYINGRLSDKVPPG
jgi:Domain of unknown function (DUF4382)